MINTVLQGDCLELMQQIPDKSIDMILCDLPYGTTACKWDAVIPFGPLWRQYERIIKTDGAIALTASQPFTSALVMSNVKYFRHEWIWKKSIAANFGSLKYGPSKHHESVLIFGKKAVNYFPQMQKGAPYTDKVRSRGNQLLEKTMDIKNAIVNTGTRYPSSIQEFANPNNFNQHPTQKPVPLFEYLIKTYTNPGETVLDNCAGSGTTAVACINTGRNYILMEKEEKYVQVIMQRIEKALAEKSKTTQGELSL
jgi:site-specific DNA-methyltransferase (adenine-specific)